MKIIFSLQWRLSDFVSTGMFVIVTAYNNAAEPQTNELVFSAAQPTWNNMNVITTVKYMTTKASDLNITLYSLFQLRSCIPCTDTTLQCYSVYYNTMNTTGPTFSSWLLLVYDCDHVSSRETDCITGHVMSQNSSVVPASFVGDNKGNVFTVALQALLQTVTMCRAPHQRCH